MQADRTHGCSSKFVVNARDCALLGIPARAAFGERFSLNPLTQGKEGSGANLLQTHGLRWFEFKEESQYVKEVGLITLKNES